MNFGYWSRSSLIPVDAFEKKLTLLAKMGKMVSCRLSTNDVGSTPWLVGMKGRIPDLQVVEGCVHAPDKSGVLCICRQSKQ